MLKLKVQTGENGFVDFGFWNFSGAPDMAGGEDGASVERPRWRSASFAAVSSGQVIPTRLATAKRPHGLRADIRILPARQRERTMRSGRSAQTRDALA